MMKLVSVLCCTLLGIGVESALASPITVNVIAHVTSIYDSSSALGGQVAVGEVIKGTYSYDTSMPNMDSSQDGYGQYLSTTLLPAAISITAGPFVFQSNQGITVTVHPGLQGLQPPNQQGIGISSHSVAAPLTLNFVSVGINFADYTGGSPSSDALPAGAPNLASFPNSTMSFSGYGTGATWYVTAQIDSVQLVPPVEVIPAAGDILPGQHFDAALLLSPGVTITSMQASVGGTPVALSYPGTCQLVAANTAGRPAILCPNAQTVLPAAGGVTQILWQVALADGTQLSQTVQWIVTP